MYGTQCVDYYIITAVSEERNVTCYASREPLTYNCSIPQGSNVNDYDFTVSAVTRGINLYNGSITSDCCKASPENNRQVYHFQSMSQLMKKNVAYNDVPMSHGR